MRSPETSNPWGSKSANVQPTGIHFVMVGTGYSIVRTQKRMAFRACLRRYSEDANYIEKFAGIDMKPRVRHCVECPKCCTRYLVGFSPYPNGSYLMPLGDRFSGEWTLYCSCGRPPISSRWSSNELREFTISNRAYDHGYGSPEEVVRVEERFIGSG